MRIKQKYLKGKSVFIVSLLVIITTILTVYLTGENYNRSITSNLYLSLLIIGIVLFIFLLYGLYKGVALVDDFPKFKNFKISDFITGPTDSLDMPEVDVSEGIGGLIISILLWIIMSILFFALLVLLEAVFWVSIFIILSMLYWVFFRALKFVFFKSGDTQGQIITSILYAFAYTMLYLGWIFVIVYLTEVLA